MVLQRLRHNYQPSNKTEYINSSFIGFFDCGKFILALVCVSWPVTYLSQKLPGKIQHVPSRHAVVVGPSPGSGSLVQVLR
jgi:hypothetical protein